jgi:hypothetical protein
MGHLKKAGFELKLPKINKNQGQFRKSLKNIFKKLPRL